MIQTWEITGMGCVSCANRIQGLLEQADVVKDVVIDVATKTMKTVSDNPLNAETINRILESTAYRVTLV